MITAAELPATLNLASWFLDRNVEQGRGNRIALRAPEGDVTYAALAEHASRAGHVLRALDVERGDRVLLALSDSVEFVAVWFGALKIGAVVAEAYTFLHEADYAYFLGYTGARVVVVDETTRAKVGAVAGVTPRLVVDPQTPLAPGEHDLVSLAAAAPTGLRAVHVERDEVALWKFTTGSTGKPKAAVHRARDPLLCHEGYAVGVLGLHEDDVVLPIPKLFFGYARDLTALFTFGVGASGVIFPERTTPERIFELVAEHRPTILVQVPTMMTAMVAHPRAAEQDFSCLRLTVSSGETLPAEIHRRWVETFGGEVLEGIGSSEAYHVYLSNRPGRTRPGTVGQPVPGVTARLVDEDGLEVVDGEIGELHLETESAAIGYHGDPERSARTFAGATIRTGDLFERDPDGYHAYRGRRDDLLKVGGIWVAPIEIEACLLEHAAVQEAAVVGVERDGLTTTRAYVVAPDGTDALPEELRTFVRTRLAPYKAPREIRVVDALPKTANGKVDRRALLESESEAA